MGSMFFWMTNPPSSSIFLQRWTGFLDLMAVVSILAVLILVVATISFYSSSARNLRVQRVEDVYRRYSPMDWLWLAGLAALIAGAICGFQYKDALGSGDGRLPVSVEIGLWTGFWTLFLSYLLILFVTPLTPSKFRERPKAWRHGTGR